MSLAGRCAPLLIGITLGLPSPVLAAPTNFCELYGFSGKPGDAATCVSGPNSRTITCKPGFHASPSQNISITLVGTAPFAGCVANSASAPALPPALPNPCLLYGYSGKANNTVSCVPGPKPGERTITCKAGYLPVKTPPPAVVAGAAVTLVGAAPFLGCAVIQIH